MTITFRDNIGPYTGKGSPLTGGEVDGNFYDIVTRVLDLEAGGDFGVDSVTYTGSTITFNWSDSTSSGPFTLPVATFHSVGPWLNNQALFLNDIVTVSGQGTFLVLQSHTTPSAPATFDPNATLGGNPLYLVISEATDYSQIMFYKGTYVPGTLYGVDDVFLNETYGLFRVAIEHISAGTFDPLATSGGLPLYTHIAGPPFSPVLAMAEETYTVSTADRGRYLRFEQSCVVTFPVLATMPIGSEIHFEQAADEDVMFTEDGTTIIPQRMGYDTATPYRGAVVTAKYVTTNTWKLIGPHGDEVSS